MRLYRSIILLLSSVGVILAISACHYRYYRTAREERPIEIGSIHFEGGKLELAVAKDSSKAIMLKDTSKAYVGIGVSIIDTVDYDRQLSLVGDSIFVKLDDSSLSYWLPGMIKYNYHNGPIVGLSLEPIGVPGDYKRDFSVTFRLQAFDKNSGELIYSKSFTVRIEYYDYKYFIFNSPYG